MKRLVNRRMILAALASGAGVAAFAGAPLQSLRPAPRKRIPPRRLPDIERMISDAGLGGHVAFAVADAGTGEILASRSPLRRMAPASVTKALTAHYALSHLGESHRFRTELIATGPVRDGQLDGDLVLLGSGDPTLDTDELGQLAEGLKEAGIFHVNGVLRVFAGALPRLPWIDGEQPDHVGYNPAIGGLNLNFNRVHFEWKRAGQSYDVTMQARAREYRPAVGVARMRIDEDRRSPVYTYAEAGGVDTWSVAKSALGSEGARWLPVRRPAAYCSDVFRTLARSHGIVLKAGPELDSPVDGSVLASHSSAPLPDMLRGMLRYSTNLTAEAVGLTASAKGRTPPDSLAASAEQMNAWLRDAAGVRGAGFVDHSGLGYESRISPVGMVQALFHTGKAGAVRPLLREFKTDDAAPEGARVHAKTGTLNFASALGGYLVAPGGREFVFAILTGDADRRDAIPLEQRERPPGARSWARRSRALQKRLIGRWADEFA